MNEEQMIQAALALKEILEKYEFKFIDFDRYFKEGFNNCNKSTCGDLELVTRNGYFSCLRTPLGELEFGSYIQGTKNIKELQEELCLSLKRLSFEDHYDHYAVYIIDIDKLLEEEKCLNLLKQMNTKNIFTISPES